MVIRSFQFVYDLLGRRLTAIEPLLHIFVNIVVPRTVENVLILSRYIIAHSRFVCPNEKLCV